ncbi:hypothetical protein TRVL_09333 [Trypanosoma vivax]|nr:hypothetical protein TRVL_09333 [Trypanosoma vivax]
MAMSVIERALCCWRGVPNVRTRLYKYLSIVGGSGVFPCFIVAATLQNARISHAAARHTGAATAGSALSRPRPLFSLPLHLCICWGVLKLVEYTKRQCARCCASSLPSACLHNVSGTHRVTSLAVAAG